MPVNQKSYRFILLIFLLLFQVSFVHSQNSSQIVKLRKELKDANSDSAKAVLHRNLSNHFAPLHLDSALHQAKKSLYFAKKQGDLYLIGRTYFTISIAYVHAEIYDSSAKYAWKAKQTFLQDKNQYWVASTHLVLGNIFLAQEMYDKALVYFREAYEMSQAIPEKKRFKIQYRVLVNTGIVYSDQQQYDSVWYYYQKALPLIEEADQPDEQASLYNNIGILKAQEGKFGESIPYFHKAIAIQESLKKHPRIKHDPRRQAHYLVSLAEAHWKLGNPDSTLFYINTVRRMMPHLEAHSLERAIALLLAEFYGEQRRYDSAFHYHQRYHQLHIDYTNEEKGRQIARLEAQFQTIRKQQEIDHLRRTNELQLVRNDRQRAWITGGVIALLFSLLSAGLWYNRSRLAKRANRAMKEQHEQIAKQHQQIQQALEEKEWLMREMHHRTKNNLFTIERLLKTQMRAIQDDEAKLAFQESQHQVEAIALIHRQLYVSPQLSSSISLKGFLLDLLDYFRNVLKDRGANIQVNAQLEDIHLEVNQAVPLGLIINEALTNAIKHAFPREKKGCILIKVLKNANRLVVEINDNGKGLLLENHTSTSQKNMGISLMNGLAKQLNASIQLENNQGTIVRISLLLDKAPPHYKPTNTYA